MDTRDFWADFFARQMEKHAARYRELRGSILTEQCAYARRNVYHYGRLKRQCRPPEPQPYRYLEAAE